MDPRSGAQSSRTACGSLFSLLLVVLLAACGAEGGASVAPDGLASSELAGPGPCASDEDCAGRLLVASGCRESWCELTTGRCLLRDRADGTPCEDGDLCSSEDRCFAGVCLAGLAFAPEPVEGAECLRLVCDPMTGALYEEPSAALCLSRQTETDPCTIWRCGDDCGPEGCEEGRCLPFVLEDGTPCNDGEACTAEDRCLAGRCEGAPVCEGCRADADCLSLDGPCAGSHRCRDGLCEPLGDAPDCALGAARPCRLGLCVVTGPESFACEERLAAPGSPCGEDGAGQCSPNGVCLEAGCGCFADSDCAVLDDGERCDGELACLAGDDGRRCCLLDPSTVVACPPEGAAEGCERWRCDPATGACLSEGAAAPGTLCQDGDACTGPDRCDAAGRCVPGPDSCRECRQDADCPGATTPLDLCVSAWRCSWERWPPVCEAAEGGRESCASVVTDPCEEARCRAEDGQCVLSARAEGAACDDGDPCTIDERCVAGRCLPPPSGGSPDCDDGEPCTVDRCVPGRGCVHTPLSEGGCPLGPDAPCRVGLCLAGRCVDAGPRLCDDTNPCTQDLCDESSGACRFEPRPGHPCEDGDPCTEGDTCDERAVCAPGPVRACGDGNACTRDRCVAGFGCAHELLSDCCGNGWLEPGEACEPPGDEGCEASCAMRDRPLGVAPAGALGRPAAAALPSGAAVVWWDGGALRGRALHRDAAWTAPPTAIVEGFTPTRAPSVASAAGWLLVLVAGEGEAGSELRAELRDAGLGWAGELRVSPGGDPPAPVEQVAAALRLQGGVLWLSLLSAERPVGAARRLMARRYQGLALPGGTWNLSLVSARAIAAPTGEVSALRVGHWADGRLAVARLEGASPAALALDLLLATPPAVGSWVYASARLASSEVAYTALDVVAREAELFVAYSRLRTSGGDPDYRVAHQRFAVEDAARRGGELRLTEQLAYAEAVAATEGFVAWRHALPLPAAARGVFLDDDDLAAETLSLPLDPEEGAAPIVLGDVVTWDAQGRVLMTWNHEGEIRARVLAPTR